MHYLWLIPYYISWHYTFALVEFFKVWKNFIWFCWHFFSIGLLSRTLLNPFERIKERYNRNLDLGKIAETLIVNVISRIFGFILRLVVIIIGLMAVILVILLGIIGFVIWLLLPFLLSFIFMNGIRALISVPGINVVPVMEVLDITEQ